MTPEALDATALFFGAWLCAAVTFVVAVVAFIIRSEL